ncbi:MAG: arsenite efflux transporter metallochaperone ArsD [Actinomycetia bacterium]|nr:arsenite efflux transporter metallochaperone ArsD [Actinomycetes bacterium]
MTAEPAPQTPHQPTVRVFEPALCCNTGVCGEDVDQSLVDFTADLHHLVEQGADISRHNLANDPAAFAADETVRAFLQVAGSAGLPLTSVDGVTVATGRYPNRAELARFCGLDVEPGAVPKGAMDLGLRVVDKDCGPEGCC